MSESDIYKYLSSDDIKRHTPFFVNVESSLDHVTKMLAGIKHGADIAIGSALKRAASSGETVAAKALTKEYHLTQRDFKRYTSTRKGKHVRSTASGTSVEIDYRGIHIPLIHFDTHIDKNGCIVSRVKRTSARETVNGAFRAKFGSHIGIYERVGEKRYPLRQLYGPATPQMLNANYDVRKAVIERVKETFDKRLDHEITRIMNDQELIQILNGRRK
ncbi:MAG: hypothetical protein IJZ89_05200 [Clostridia bacterium]|nr:hypothetical protein [Clostridia bacterium]